MSTLTQKLQLHYNSLNQLQGRLTTFRIQTKGYLENCLKHYVNIEGLLDWQINNASMPNGYVDSISLHQSDFSIKYSNDVNLLRKGGALSFNLKHLGFIDIILNPPYFDGQVAGEPYVLYQNLMSNEITSDLIAKSIDSLIEAATNWNEKGAFEIVQDIDLAFV